MSELRAENERKTRRVWDLCNQKHWFVAKSPIIVELASGCANSRQAWELPLPTTFYLTSTTFKLRPSTVHHPNLPPDLHYVFSPCWPAPCAADAIPCPPVDHTTTI